MITPAERAHILAAVQRGNSSRSVMDGFLPESLARDVAAEFLPEDAPAWHRYDSPLELKLASNNWNAFGPRTYSLLSYLMSQEVLGALSAQVGMQVHADPGLCGGGLHAHGRGGKLNVHLDYATHRKVGLARKLNLIVYLTPDWREEWGGALGFFGRGDAPGDCEERVTPLFNRAVLFDTMGQWHGLPEPIACPAGQMRRSLAIYYLVEEEAAPRKRALFAPTAEQEGDTEVLELIRQRVS